jgi:hypothetical protein
MTTEPAGSGFESQQEVPQTVSSAPVAALPDPPPRPGEAREETSADRLAAAAAEIDALHRLVPLLELGWCEVTTTTGGPLYRYWNTGDQQWLPLPDGLSDTLAAVIGAGR